MQFAQWCRLWRAGRRNVPVHYTDVVNPVLSEAQQARANQAMEQLLRSYLAAFLVEAREQNSAFSHTCYFFNRMLRVPVWVALHQLTFDVPWAGRFRSYDISRGFACDEFSSANELLETAQRVMGRLRARIRALKATPHRSILIDYLTQMHTYLNYVHPFAEGNGRVQRLYMNFVAGYYGWLIDWSQVNRDAYLDAVRCAFRQDQAPLNALLEGAFVPLEGVEWSHV